MYYTDSYVVINVTSNVTVIFPLIDKIMIDRNGGKIFAAEEIETGKFLVAPCMYIDLITFNVARVV